MLEVKSELRVEKYRAPAVLTLSNGTVVTGCFFLSLSSASHTGPERIKDLLNDDRRFFPFEVTDGAGARVVLYSRDHILHVTLPSEDEAHADPGYELATCRPASILLTDGVRLSGLVRVYRPIGRDRLSDFAKVLGRFHYFEAPHGMLLINVEHVVELTETGAE